MTVQDINRELLQHLQDQITKQKQEMDAMWEHIRNLERKLLNPTEYEIYY